MRKIEKRQKKDRAKEREKERDRKKIRKKRQSKIRTGKTETFKERNYVLRNCGSSCICYSFVGSDYLSVRGKSGRIYRRTWRECFDFCGSRNNAGSSGI